MLQPLPFIGGANAGRNVALDTQALINFYAEGDPRDTRTPKYAVPTPGATLKKAVAAGVGRGLYAYNNLLYAIVGNTLYEVNPSLSYAVTSRGTLASSAGYTMMVDNGPANGHQLMIIDSSGNGYVYDSTAHTLTQLTTVTNGWPSGGAVTLTWQDGYGIFDQTNTGVFWWTKAYDFTNIPGLNFATAEGNPDNLVAAISDQTRLYLLGTQSLEVWYDAGLQNQAFVRIPGAVFPKGCAASLSPQRIDNSIVWLGTNPYGQTQVYQVRGASTPMIISNPQMEYKLQQYSTISDAQAFTYQSEGHEFYVLTFPTAGVTWVWDASNREWHQRSTSGGAWYPQAYAFLNGTHYTLDSSGNLLAIDSTATTDNGTAITRTIISPHLGKKHERLGIDFVEVLGNFGTGITAGTFTLSWSKDNGNTFPSSWTYTITSTTTQRAYRYRLGMSRDWVFKLTTTAAPIIFGMYVDMDDYTMQMPRIQDDAE